MRSRERATSACHRLPHGSLYNGSSGDESGETETGTELEAGVGSRNPICAESSENDGLSGLSGC